MKKPNAFQEPGWFYNSTTLFSHHDAFGRASKKPLMDRYLHPMDGRLRKLIVASSDDIYEGPGTSTWRRTYVRNVAPWNVSIATWVTDFDHDPNSWKAYVYMLIRAAVANVALQIAFYIKCYTFFTTETARWMFEGKYAPVPIEFNGNAKVWNNSLENRRQNNLEAREYEPYRVLEPRELCFLKEPKESQENLGVDKRLVQDWKGKEGKDQNLSYIFVAYFTQHFQQENYDDKMALTNIAERAARAAGVAAYWVGACNMGSTQEELKKDVSKSHIVPLAIQILKALTGFSNLGCITWCPQSGHRCWST